jgi:hypothetical protein
VIDPRGVLTDPVIDFASLKAELQAALAQAEAMEKAEAEGLVPKTQDEIKSALGDLDYAQRQIEAARAELQDRLKGGGSKGS